VFAFNGIRQAEVRLFYHQSLLEIEKCRPAQQFISKRLMPSLRKFFEDFWLGRY
jgi:hypothetical protein